MRKNVMASVWVLILFATAVLLVGGVIGWAIRGYEPDVAVVEAVGTWLGAVAGTGAVIVALYLGYESQETRKKRDDQLDQDMAYTRRLLEASRRQQAGRIIMGHTGWIEGPTFDKQAIPYTMWTLTPRIGNQSETTIHDLEASLAPIDRTAIDGNPEVNSLRIVSPFLPPGQVFGPTLRVAMPIGSIINDQNLRPALQSTDAAGQRWRLDHERRLTEVLDVEPA